MSFNTDLLTVNRLDVIFKFLYLRFKKTSPIFAKQLYHDHIKIITNGLFKEIDNQKKNFEDFIIEFENINKSIETLGFNSKISKIPISNDGSISNGAHRLASSLYNNIKVNTIQTSQNSHNYNYEFFRTRSLENHLLEFGVLNYLELTENNYLAIIWPSADKNIKYIHHFESILYEKKMSLNSNGAQNFVAQVYKDHKWVGSFKEGYSGAITKVAEAFKSFDEIHFIFFQMKSFDEVSKLKKKLRSLFAIGKASIHITDNNKETIELGKIILNPNSLHFLNNSKPYVFESLFKKLKKFKKLLNDNNINLEDIVLTSSTILGIYGYREPSDIDFLSAENFDFNQSLQSHNYLIDYYETDKNELIYNPKFHFYFSDFKFLSLDEIKKFKKNRNEIKDRLDLELLKRKQSFNKTLFLLSLKNKINKSKFQFIAIMIPLSKKYKFYNFAKWIYKKITN